MLIDIAFVLQENVDKARAFFEAPSRENSWHALTPDTVERVFGHEVVSEGIYYVGSPNTANFLGDVLMKDGRYSDEWCGHRSYGTADSIEEILAYARPAELDQPCVLLIDRVGEIHEKSGPWLGPRDAHDRPAPSEVVLDWSLVPIDAEKLAAKRQAMETAAFATPGP